MKGIYYSRMDENEIRDKWGVPKAGDSIIVPTREFKKFFPEMEIQGEIQWNENCDNPPQGCGDCEQCGSWTTLTFDDSKGFTVAYTGNQWNQEDHQKIRELGQFQWDWSGHGATEWWFDDEAICLKKSSDYCSQSGLTADASRVAAFARKVKVASYRGDCGDKPGKPESGLVWAEFRNEQTQYRSNWTGFAIGVMDDSENMVTDDLDSLVSKMLAKQEVKATTCRHNPGVKFRIVASKREEVSRLLCRACRAQGIRWEEFTQRNRGDVCPYLKRAAKAVVSKSDPLPEWFKWQGDLLASYRRMKTGDHEAFEIVFVRRRDKLIRRAVLLLKNSEKEGWLYPYNGYIPPYLKEFQKKYKQGRQIF